MNWTLTGKHSASAPDVRNDPHLIELVPVQVTRPFCVGGNPLQIGAAIRLSRHDAISMQALRKCLLLE